MARHEAEPPLHAVEVRAIRQPAQRRRRPRLRGRTLQSSAPDLLGGHQLPTTEEPGFVDCSPRPLVGDIEGAEAVDLIAEEIDADRVRRGGSEDIDDATSHRHLATVLHLRFAAVPHRHERGHQLIDADAIPGADHHRVSRLRGQPLEQRSDRSDHDLGLGPSRQAPSDAESLPHHRHLRAHSLEGQRVPSGQQDHRAIVESRGCLP